MESLGCIQVYTGNGKGKTTASLGLAVRALGHGYKVCMIQFMKDWEEYGERKAATLLANFTLLSVGRNEFVNLENPEPIDRNLAQKGWLTAKEAILSGKYAIVILDEINVAMACGLIDVNEVVTFITQDFTALQPRPELVLTGRYAPSEVIALAQVVTEMQEVRHIYQQGMEARKGIEY